MIVVHMSGGLGNQMFQYALYKQLEYMGKEVRIDDFTHYETVGSRNKQIEVFDIFYKQATMKDIMRLTDTSKFFLDRLRRKIFGKNSKIYKEIEFSFDDKVFKLEDAYLEGYWQSEKYFSDVKELIKNNFQFPIPSDIRNSSYLEHIKSTNSVGVHIRRGDYLTEKFSGIYSGICTQSYYDKAMKIMREWYSDCHFFIFSNDSEWVQNEYCGNEYTIIRGNSEDSGYFDMMLMSNCKHQIIANSSFSWWAAWLNSNQEKKIIAPNRWINGKDAIDIYTSKMIRID